MSWQFDDGYLIITTKFIILFSKIKLYNSEGKVIHEMGSKGYLKEYESGDSFRLGNNFSKILIKVEIDESFDP